MRLSLTTSGSLTSGNGSNHRRNSASLPFKSTFSPRWRTYDDNVVSPQYDRAKFSSLLYICYIRCFLQQQIEVLIEPLQFPPQLLSTSQSHKNDFSKAFIQDFGGHFAHICPLAHFFSILSSFLRILARRLIITSLHPLFLFKRLFTSVVLTLSGINRLFFPHLLERFVNPQ